MKSSTVPRLDDTSGVLQTFEALKSKTNGYEPSWLCSVRKDAAARFSELNFPTVRDEEWKYTSVEPIVKNSFSFNFDASTNSPAKGKLETFLFGEADWNLLVFVNGIYSKELSSVTPRAEGIEIGSLAEALKSRPARLEPYLTRQVDFKSNKFTALNTAFLGDGAFIYIPKGKTIQKPVELLFISISEEEKIIAQPRNLLVLGEGSRAEVIESYVSLNVGPYFTNAVTEIFLEPAASLDHYKIQRENPKAFHVATTEVSCERASAYQSYFFTFGAGLSRENLNVALRSEGASCLLNGLYFVSGTQHTDHHTAIDHTRPGATSSQTYKGVLSGEAKAVFNGKIFVRPLAQKTDAHQTNKNLLLSGRAAVDTKPQLEIFADDVKCSHGAAVGELDPSEIFYIRSRGISEEHARNLLTYGFAGEVIHTVKLEPVRSSLDRLVWQALS